MDDKVIVDLLGQVGNLFTSSLELKETIDFMLKAASDLVACDAATVFLLDEDGKSLSAIATFPFTESVAQVATFELGEGIVGWASQRRKVVSVVDATKDSRFKNLPMAHAPRSCLVMPLQSPQRLVGALTMARREVRPFTSVEQALMQVIANQAAISIDNARLHARQTVQLAQIAEQKRELERSYAQINEISRLKSEFLANMSHELRTPLNAILGFSEILKDNLVALEEEQRHECLENIHTSGKHLLELVNDVLDLSKIEAGRMELSYDDFFVNNAVREVHNVIRSLSERRDIDLSIDVVPEDLLVRADKSKFKQVLYNLLSNAIKFTAQGGRVWVKARVGGVGHAVPRGGRHRCRHSSRAPRAHLQRVLPGGQRHHPSGRGHRARPVADPSHHRAARRHDGAGERAGHWFGVHLPPAAGGPADPNGHRHNRILLVEDNRSNRELATMVLSGNGFEVDIAVDGNEGLHKARSSPYDLVLMDIELPGIDGLTVTRMLKSDPKTSSIPVVALTANAMKGNEQEALAAGCSGYISKPIEVANFVQRIATYLETEAS